MTPEIDALIQRYIDGTISAADLQALNDALANDDEARSEFADLLNVDSAIAAAVAGWKTESDAESAFASHAGQETRDRHRPNDELRQPPSLQSNSMPVRDRSGPRYWFLAAIAGLMLGILGTRWVNAFVGPAAATVDRLTSLLDPSFEGASGKISAGFPQVAGVWSGDEAEVVPAKDVIHRDGAQALRFLKPGPDAGNPGGDAISCDVFQIVDLKPLRASLRDGGDAVLELAANFLDARRDSNGSLTFICQIFIFSGDSDSLHQAWPRNLGSALGSGAELYDTGGGDLRWKTLTARCLVDSRADFAVVQLGARCNGARRELSQQYVDRVQLSLKTQPHLPVRNRRN